MGTWAQSHITKYKFSTNLGVLKGDREVACGEEGEKKHKKVSCIITRTKIEIDAWNTPSHQN